MYGESAFGESGFGEGPSSVVGEPVGISGSLQATELPDVLAALGIIPMASAPLVADPNALVIVVELQLGQF